MIIKKNNKGAAFVTVLIALLFIALLATSLIYMATMNYLAKSMRYYSTDNYYTDEYALADLSTTLQNIAAQKTTKNEAVTAIRSAVGKTGTGTNLYWTNEAVQALIQIASEEATITVSASPEYDTDGDGIADVPNYEEGKNFVMLKGVMLRSTTPDTGYVSLVSSDIKIVFESNMGELDVNDFSVITNAPITFTKNETVWAGLVYVGGEGKGSPALTLNNGSIITMLGQRGIISGDVKVGTGCTLIIYGNVTVYGNIEVETGGSLICTGRLIYEGNLTKRSGSTVKGTEYISDITTPNWNLRQKTDVAHMGIDGDGDDVEDYLLASAILSPVYVRCSDGGCTTWHKVTLADVKTANGGFGGGHMAYTNSGVTVDIGISYPQAFTTPDHLVLDTGNVKINDSSNITGVTVVGTRSIEFGETNNYVQYMTSMPDDKYELAQTILWGGSGQCPTSEGTKNVSCASGTWDGVTPIAGATDQYVISEPDATKGTTGRTVYYKGGMNYIPTGFFISEDASSIISEAFAASQGDLDPKNTYIIYTNYNKY